jgi:transcriptional regulator with XRE-family HTH domain
MNNMESFSEWIQNELDERGWSRLEAARRGGISASMFDKIINGYSKPGLKFCVGIARAFNMPAEIVLRRADLLPQRTEETPVRREMLYLFDQLTEETQETVITMLRGYVRETAVPYTTKTTRS